jgi:hypothetical protein
MQLRGRNTVLGWVRQAVPKHSRSSPLSFAAINYWVSTHMLPVPLNVWQHLVLDYSPDPKCFDDCLKEGVRNNNYSMVE